MSRGPSAARLHPPLTPSPFPTRLWSGRSWGILSSMLRRHHYECAFEEFLRSRRIPYVAVDEARKTLLPRQRQATSPSLAEAALKSFDFVVYGAAGNLLIDIKGRRLTGRRLESWATLEDVESLHRWEALFGPGFEAAFIFIYACEQQPPDTLFEEVIEHRGTWYILRSVLVREYARVMKLRSQRWRTVDIPGSVFPRISRPFTGADSAPVGGSAYDSHADEGFGGWAVPALAGLDDVGGLPV